MNNMFHAFSIKVPGALLDDKFFFDYSDYHAAVENLTIDDTNSKAKAVAYVRMFRLKQELSKLQVPVYLTVKFGTAGTALTVPSDAEIVVGFGSLENLTSTGIVDDATLNAAKVSAVALIRGIIETVLDQDHVMYSWVVSKYSRMNNPIANIEVEHIGLREEYITAPKVTPSVTVQYVALQAPAVI